MKTTILIFALFCVIPPQLRATEESFRVQILAITPEPDAPDEYRISLRQFEQPYSKRPLKQPRQIVWHIRYAAATFQHDSFLTHEEYLRAVTLLRGCLAHAEGRFQLALASGGFWRPADKPGEWFSSTLSHAQPSWSLPEGANRKELLIYTYAKAP